MAHTTQRDYEEGARLAKALLQARLIAPALHIFLFLCVGICYGSSHEGLAEGLTGVFFGVLMIVDLPFSIFAFGIMFGGGRDGAIALIAWIVGCTIWWFLLGWAFDAWLRRRRSRARLQTSREGSSASAANSAGSADH